MKIGPAYVQRSCCPAHRLFQQVYTDLSASNGNGHGYVKSGQKSAILQTCMLKLALH